MRRLAPALAGLPLALLLAACKPEAEAAAPTPEVPRPVQVALVAIAPIEPPRSLTGTIRPRREADIAFRTGGRLVERLADVGQRVRAGDLLARLDPADLALALRQAEAQLAAAEASARQAGADARRSATLLAAGHVAAAYDDQRQAAARSAAEQVTVARANVALARNRLSYAELRAPGEGVVTALLAETGQVVAEGAAVLRLAETAERELVVPVPENLLPLLERARASAEFWSRPGERLAVRLRELAPQAETSLRTYQARFSLPEAPDWLALGMTGTIRLESPGASAATLPVSALHDRGAGPIVWRVAGQRVEAVPVRVLGASETVVRLAGRDGAALAEGDRIVSLGPQLLDPGQPVRVIETRLSATLR